MCQIDDGRGPSYGVFFVRWALPIINKLTGTNYDKTAVMLFVLNKMVVLKKIARRTSSQ